MEFRHLEVFVAVAEQKSFSRAAEQLYLTQPTVSSHIHSLEKELGTTLIQRTTKSIQLTAEGETFLSYAKRLVELKESALTSIHVQKKSMIRLGVSTTPSLYLLPKLLHDFRETNPHILFDIIRGDSDTVEDRIVDGSLDIGMVGFQTSRSHCVYQPFAQDHLVIGMPATDHYRSLIKDNPSVKKILQEPMIIREKGSGTLQEALRLLPQEQISADSLNIVIRHSDPESIIKMVASGMGISIFTEFAVKEAEKNGSILVYPLNQSKPRQFYTLYSDARTLSPAAEQFLDFANNYYK